MKEVATKRRKSYQPLLGLALILGGVFQLALPVLADGTAAGTSISNTATATYEDPNNPNVPINATSNTVTITVAEVAGITVTASGVTDVNGGSVQVGDQLYYAYTITNVGNDPTKFRIPNLATVTGPATVLNTTGNTQNLEYSTDGGTTWTPMSGTEYITTPFVPGGSILVRVPVVVAAGATAGNVITVKLGQTPGDQQNQLRSPDGGDVYTVDATPGETGATGEAANAPINDTREASNSQQTTVAATAQAFATVLKALGSYTDPNGTPATLTDDLLTYNLSLRVESSAPIGSTGLVPADLVGTSINLDTGTGATPQTRILVSDAIPAGTVFNSVVAPPAGWTVVYSIDDPAVTGKAANDSTVIWTTTAPAANTVKRIGFINNGPIAKGTTVTGLQFRVSPIANTGVTVNNIAQLFGQTSGGGTTLVYDESGDQRPSNSNDDGTPGSNIPTNGVANPTNEGVDSANNNSGSGPGGEDNVYTINNPANQGILNGPKDAPAAIGPTSNNDDFTNKSTLIPANLAPNQPVDPAAVGFTNTVQNTGAATQTVSLIPVAPAVTGDLPNGTTVTISYGSVSASYTYSNGIFTITAGNTPITISVPAATSVSYGVEVNLPSSAQLVGYPVPITAFADTDGTAGLSAGDPQNTTIDRVYTGFLKLVKKSRILQGTGPVVGTGQDNFESTPTANGIEPNPGVLRVPRTPAPGNIIEYLIEYTNISTSGGTGNVLLNAGNVVISEDGTINGNNWALDSPDPDAIIDTSNVIGSAIDSGASTITFFSGSPATTSVGDQTGTTTATDVSKYIDKVTGTVGPTVTRTFRFQRKVN